MCQLLSEFYTSAKKHDNLHARVLNYGNHARKLNVFPKIGLSGDQSKKIIWQSYIEKTNDIDIFYRF